MTSTNVEMDSEDDAPGPSARSSSAPQPPPLIRMDTVLSEGGEKYDVLPMPSPGVEEVDNAVFSPGYKPRIPYMSIYSSPSRIFVGVGTSFLAKTPVTLKVLDVRRDTTYRNPLHPNIYTLEVTHGQFTWKIHRRYNHFAELHEKLWEYRTLMKLPLPSKSHRHRRKTTREASKSESKMPKFPKRPELWVSTEAMEKRKEQLTLYLNAMLESKLYRNNAATKKFLEVSRFSFIQDLGTKGKEGLVKKRSGGHKINLRLCGGCCDSCEMFASWKERWFVVKDTFIAYSDPSQEKVKGVILFDSMLSVAHINPSKELVISNSSRSLQMSCQSEKEALEWKKSINQCVAKLCSGLADEEIRLQSFAPQRPDSYAYWFVDGRSYMSALADALEKAREEIYITDWWLSPEIYLKRPIERGDYWRLDKVLQRKADEGVKIYVQLYKEVEVAVGLDSAYTKRTLQALNPKNIRVVRHPDLAGETLLYAHHEKIVVVDQTVAFIGGIDLCYGRWDFHSHRLTDVQSFMATNKHSGSAPASPGYTVKPQTAQMEQSSTAAALGMFWAMTMGVVEHVSEVPESPKPKEPSTTGSKEGSRLKKFLSIRGRRKERKSEGGEDIKMKKTEGDAIVIPNPGETETLLSPGYGATDDYAPLMSSHSTPSTVHHSPTDGGRTPSPRREEASERNGHNLGRGTKYLQTYQDMVNQVEKAGKSRLWIGKDYYNNLIKDPDNLADPFEGDTLVVRADKDVFDRMTTPRMPWHDIASVTYGSPARDAARHFIQRWNFTKLQKKKTGENVPYLLPKSYSEDAFNLTPDMILPEAVKANVQILRSSCEWSAGISDVDCSIQNAYLYAIEKSEHFIYIENQFFISCRNNSQVSNQICEALYQRILRAHRENKKFRVYVVMPLIPGFAGDLSDSSKSQAIRTVLHWQYKSISRGTGSLIEDLNKEIGIGKAWSYITFCGLRQHAELNDKPVSEIVYVHSKMLIVDDRIVIIGSANINDRSMCGKRDSEVALLVEDTQMTSSTMDGQPFEVGLFGSSLRRRCFCEHLGLLPDDYDGTLAAFDPMTHEAGQSVADVVSDTFFKDVWTHTAAVNTTVYEKAFSCLPSDYVRQLSDAQDLRKEVLSDVDPNAARKELTKVKGHLVLLPLLFLIDEVLTPEAMTKEAIAPTNLWT